VLSISFVVEGVAFIAIKGGFTFQLNEAVSFVVYCKDQEEVDCY
jgi:predicted 3-demethylubiquinone-9 3-methyltransferase (glyoxalase superfamily)